MKIRLRYIHAFVDRHGNRRYYYRRHGRRVALSGQPGTPEFMAAYSEAGSVTGASERVARPQAAPGTFAALAGRYFASPMFLSKAANTQRNYRRSLGVFLAKHGSKRTATLEAPHVEAIIGGMADRPGNAIELLRCLNVLLNYGVRMGLAKHNPAARCTAFRSSALHTWTEAELETFEARWPVGTRQRLAFALLLYTGQRSSDVYCLRWPSARGFELTQKKTSQPMVIPVHPELVRVLAATKREHAVVLASTLGKAYTHDSFRALIRSAIRDAGLPDRCTPHGLRKAMARRLAEGDATARQIMAVTGHKTLSEVERYTAAANQPHLAQQAFEKQVANKDWQPPRQGLPNQRKNPTKS